MTNVLNDIKYTKNERHWVKKYDTGKNAGEADMYTLWRNVFECKGKNWHSTRKKI